MARKKKQSAGADLPQNREKKGVTAHFSDRPIGDRNPPVETQFQKGISGNPGGRPKKIGEAQAANLARLFPQYLITPEMQKAIDETYGGENVRITYAEKIALQQQLAAAAGDVQAAREVRASTDGLKVQHSGDAADPVVFRVVYGNDEQRPLSD